MEPQSDRRGTILTLIKQGADNMDFLLGVMLSLVGAIALAGVSLFVRLGTEEGRVTDAVIFTASMNLLILLPAVAVVYYPNYGLTRFSFVSFAAAGLTGTVLGRILRYTSIMKIGASRTEPIVTAWVIFASLLGVVVLDETLTVLHALGILCVVGGIALIAWETGHEQSKGLSRRQLMIGLTIPIVASLFMGSEPIFASLGLAEGTPAPVGATIKSFAGLSGLLLYFRLTNTLPGPVVMQAKNTRWFVLAGLSSTFALLCYYFGLVFVPVNVLAPIFATNVLFVIILSRLVMPQRLERVTWKLVSAATIVVAGVVLVTAVG